MSPGGHVSGELPYLPLGEAAELGCLSPKRLQNLMAAGVLIEGVHFFRPRSRHPLFHRVAYVAWLEGRDEELIRKARGRRAAS